VSEHSVLHTAYCVARHRGKNYQSARLWNTTQSKRRLNRPFPWRSMKLFTTNLHPSEMSS